MPELPDIECYLSALRPRVLGAPLERVRIASPFLLRSVEPSIADAEGREVTELRRLGKRLVLRLEGELFCVLHLMVAGRLRWRERGARVPKKVGLCGFDFPSGTAVLTEAGSKRRAWLRVVRGEKALAQLDPGGLEVRDLDRDGFATALTRENHTVKRALTDPRILSGIGNAFSDEILHRAGVSPVTWTTRLRPEDMDRLYEGCRAVLDEWTVRLRAEVGDGFPEKVTAFREGFAVHGRYKKPCPACGAPVQRIRYASNETNYCPRCQTGGKLLRDRSLSRLLKADWPRTLEELEAGEVPP